MAWKKKGQIYKPDGSLPWSVSHAQIPVPMKIDKDRLRIYFSTRDKRGRSQPAFVEVDLSNPQKILYVHDRPLWNFGEPGLFDDSGIMPASWIRKDGLIYMYYVGWNPQVTNAYHLATGLAVSEDYGVTFKKYTEGPIMDRDLVDPFWCTIPCVIQDGEQYRAWYISCTGWKKVGEKMEPVYLVKHAVSYNAIHWYKTDNICIPYQYDGEAIGRPWVIKEDNVYKMWYSTRGSEGYRTGKGQPYHLGYAESLDGLSWKRMDDQSGMHISDSGWDSQMNCYASVYHHNKNMYLLYNGNGFGQEGFGYAIWKEE